VAKRLNNDYGWNCTFMIQTSFFQRNILNKVGIYGSSIAASMQKLYTEYQLNFCKWWNPSSISGTVLSLLLSSGKGEMIEHIRVCESSHSKHPDFERFKGCVKQEKMYTQTKLVSKRGKCSAHTHTYVYTHWCFAVIAVITVSRARTRTHTHTHTHTHINSCI